MNRNGCIRMFAVPESRTRLLQGRAAHHPSSHHHHHHHHWFPTEL